MVRPVNANACLLQNVMSLSGSETQIITGAVSAMFRKRSSLSRRQPRSAFDSVMSRETPTIR